ncbi:hypothetical protein TNCV_5016961 [Trichonephila clavipes]|nr:hypothetical protein TNCV_5016961 [Trichonephila clavipes]
MGSGILVWGGVMMNGWIEIHIFTNRCSLIGDHYYNDFIPPQRRLFEVMDFCGQQRRANRHMLFESFKMRKISIEWIS